MSRIVGQRIKAVIDNDGKKRRVKYPPLQIILFGDALNDPEVADIYRLVLSDPYWIRLMEELISKGIPRSIAETALIRADRERSLMAAYA